MRKMNIGEERSKIRDTKFSSVSLYISLPLKFDRCKVSKVNVFWGSPFLYVKRVKNIKNKKSEIRIANSKFGLRNRHRFDTKCYLRKWNKLHNLQDHYQLKLYVYNCIQCVTLFLRTFWYYSVHTYSFIYIL